MEVVFPARAEKQKVKLTCIISRESIDSSNVPLQKLSFYNVIIIYVKYDNNAHYNFIMQHNIYIKINIYSLGYTKADFHVVSHVPQKDPEKKDRRSGVALGEGENWRSTYTDHHTRLIGILQSATRRGPVTFLRDASDQWVR